MAENNSESVDVDPPPHSNTDTPGTVTCLPVAAVHARGRVSFCSEPWIMHYVIHFGVSFFRGTHLVTDLKPLAPPYRPSVSEVCSVLSRRAKYLRKKKAKNTYKSKIIIPTLFIRSGTSISLFTANFVAVRGAIALIFRIVW